VFPASEEEIEGELQSSVLEWDDMNNGELIFIYYY
jgi:hypothetical protein